MYFGVYIGVPLCWEATACRYNPILRIAYIALGASKSMIQWILGILHDLKYLGDCGYEGHAVAGATASFSYVPLDPMIGMEKMAHAS